MPGSSSSDSERQAFKTSPPAPVYVVFVSDDRYPDKIVVWRFTDEPDPLPLAIVDTLEDARAAILTVAPSGQCVGRDRLDDLAIAEKWIL